MCGNVQIIVCEQSQEQQSRKNITQIVLLFTVIVYCIVTLQCDLNVLTQNPKVSSLSLVILKLYFLIFTIHLVLNGKRRICCQCIFLYITSQ